ncbi:MAG: hypothetical protein AAFX78_03390 [Cyanobacteria bacterium J06638_20]
MTDLPSWLTQGTFASDGFTIFAVTKVQRAQPPKSDVVLVDAREHRHPLEQCHLATLKDLPSAGLFVDAHGTECVLSVVNDLALLSTIAMNDIRRVRLPGLRNAVSVAAAARAIAQEFDGVIVEDYDDD